MADPMHFLPPAAATKVGRRELDERTVEALRHHAPAILALEPGASWSPVLEGMIVAAATGPQAHPGDVRRVRKALSRVLARGQQLGRWTHAGPVPPTKARVQPDRLALVSREDVARAEARRTKLLGQLDKILTCNSTRVLKGALIVAAADLSAVLVEQLLARIPALFDVEPCAVREERNIAWINLPLGKEGTPARPKTWKNQRRWILDGASTRIAAALVERGVKVPASAQTCVAALMRFLDLPEISVEELCRTARSWWALQLDETMHRYATTMILGPSLPDRAFVALLDGRRRFTEESAHVPAAGDLGNEEGDQNDPLSMPPECSRRFGMRARMEFVPLGNHNYAPHRVAVRDLIRVFDKFTRAGAREPRQGELVERLEGWNARHRQLGGWVVLFGDWARASIDRNYLPGAAQPAMYKSIHRYLGGIAQPFLSHLYQLAPDELLVAGEDELDDFADGFDRLRDQIAKRGAASTDKEGLQKFLRFVRSVGGPEIYLGSDWRTVVSACDADANLLTEAEYQRVLAELSSRGPTGSYPVTRARAITILTYRLGLRWEEVQTRRLTDMQATERHASLWVRRNPYFRGKTRSSLRKLPIELFLTPDEFQEVVAFMDQARRLKPGRPDQDMLFADPQALGEPPHKDMTYHWIVDAMRNQSGDPTLVFHHLRHSAATQLFCRLMVDPSPEWCVNDWTLQSVKHFTNAPGAYVASLTGRTASDGSRLFAVSNLLGHIDPTTTMRYYVHLADMALAAHAMRKHAIPPKVLAGVASIKLDSVYKARSRKSRRYGRKAARQ